MLSLSFLSVLLTLTLVSVRTLTLAGRQVPGPLPQTFLFLCLFPAFRRGAHLGSYFESSLTLRHIQSLHKYFMSTYYVPGTFLSTGESHARLPVQFYLIIVFLTLRGYFFHFPFCSLLPSIPTRI